MATKLAMTATVKAIDSQRWICRTHVFQFNGTSSEDEPKGNRQTSIYPCQDLLQGCKESRQPALGALVVPLLIRPEARLLHAQVGPRARRGESPSDDLSRSKTPQV